MTAVQFPCSWVLPFSNMTPRWSTSRVQRVLVLNTGFSLLPSNINPEVWRHRRSTACLCCTEAFAIMEKNIMRSDGWTFFWAVLKFWWKNTQMKMDIKQSFAPQNLFNHKANPSRTHRRAGLFTLQGQKIYRMCSVAEMESMPIRALNCTTKSFLHIDSRSRNFQKCIATDPLYTLSFVSL